MFFLYNLERYSEINDISKNYIKDNNLEQIIQDLYWCLHELFNCIPITDQNLFSGHNAPIIYATEEFEISVSLAMMGLYRQSICSLRNVFELGLLSIYWNIDDYGHVDIQDWKKSIEDTPRISNIRKKLQAHKNVKKLQDIYNLNADLIELNDLHNFVHFKGYNYSNYLGAIKGNVPEFIENSFQKWLTYSKKIIKLVCILHLLKYPSAAWDYNYHNKFGFDVPSFPHTRFGKIELLENLIGKNLFNSIKNIAEQDEDFIEFQKWILSLPDMTEEQHKMQNVDFLKSRIEQEGYIKVLKWYEDIKDNKKISGVEKDIEIIKSLEQWSISNNYMSDKLSRIKKKND